MELQQTANPAYSLEDIHQLLLVLEHIKNLSLRPEQTEKISRLIQQLTSVMSSKSFPVQLSAERHEQVQTLLESLTPAEIDRIDREIGEPPIEVAVVTKEELQQVLSVFDEIVNLNLRPQQTESIQFLIQQLKALLAQGRSEILLKAGQALQIQAIANSLTADEQKRLQQMMPWVGEAYRLTQTELQELLTILRDLQQFPGNPDIAQMAGTLVPTLEELEAIGQPEAEIQGIHAAQLQRILKELMPL